MGNKNLIKNVNETLIYYFVPFILLGGWYYFKKHNKSLEQTFYISSFIIVNILILLAQISFMRFLSRRHNLPLIALTIFFIPIGIELVSKWISERTSKGKPVSVKDTQCWFFILILIGIVICMVKLTNHNILQKVGYRNAAVWLSKNVDSSDIVASFDKRIPFYAQLNGFEYDHKRKISKQANYIVKNDDERPKIDKDTEEVFSTWVTKEKKKKVTIWFVHQ
jgi:uncharacterized membrane protein